MALRKKLTIMSKGENSCTILRTLSLQVSITNCNMHKFKTNSISIQQQLREMKDVTLAGLDGSVLGSDYHTLRDLDHHLFDQQVRYEI